ncbi:MAG: T9SS type A sorting domain-containing protein, partial [Bacteroidetes bacterium]|nr:T9SS type A sorting domain-containing protein [Bacteroidota bacterium]
TSLNNNIEDKDQYISTIVQYVQPDVFTVNEVSGSGAIHQHLLDRAVNADGSDKYKMAPFIFTASPYLVNLLFYNHKKLTLHSHAIAQSTIRDVDVYKLYYNSNDLAEGDTAFVICVVAHLKAGNSAGDAENRATMAQNTMTFLENYGDDENYLLSGDFNVYTSTEEAYQTFTQYPNTSLRFSDPIDKPGAWNNNSVFAAIHTQSTHSTSSGCPASGGMDDRFDFILMSNNLKFGVKHLTYVPGSYHAVGQDGLHFNKDITDSPTNTSVPSDVLTALYGNSDHLPVTLKLAVDKSLDVSDWLAGDFQDIRFNNPVTSQIRLTITTAKPTRLHVDLFNLCGKAVFKHTENLISGQNQLVLHVDGIPSGMYLMKMSRENKQTVTRKLVIN